MHLKKPEWDWQVGCWEGRRALEGGMEQRQAFPEQYLIDFHFYHHSLPVFFITEPYFFSTQHIFLVILFSCLLDYSSDLYECSDMSAFFSHVPNT